MKPIFTMMIGLPASGKSTYAEKLGAKVISSDKLREELYGDVNDQTHNTEVFNELHKRIKEELKNGNDVVYDATNLNRKRRMAFLRELDKIDCSKECILMATPIEECFERNRQREKKVPNPVLTKFYRHFEVPAKFEGWNKIRISYGEHNEYRDVYGSKNDFIKATVNFNQESKYHDLTLGEHCLKAYHSVLNSNNQVLKDATLLHDCGKPRVKSIFNGKGEITGSCTYYNHDFCGSYDSLFYKTINPLEVSLIIGLHMHPYFWKDAKDINKTKKKYERLWGSEVYDLVMTLHEADVNAH